MDLYIQYVAHCVISHHWFTTPVAYRKLGGAYDRSSTIHAVHWTTNQQFIIYRNITYNTIQGNHLQACYNHMTVNWQRPLKIHVTCFTVQDLLLLSQHQWQLCSCVACMVISLTFKEPYYCTLQAHWQKWCNQAHLPWTIIHTTHKCMSNWPYT